MTAGLDDLSPGAKDGHPREGRGAAGSTEIFVPAPVEEVWDFLVDPARLPEWDAGTGNVDLNGEQDRVGGEGAVGISWTGEAPRARPDGKPVKVKGSVRRRHLELLAAVRPTHVAWRTSYPDAKVVIPVTTEFDLTPTTGGTQLRISTSWRRSGGWRRAAGLPLRPLQKFFVWLSLVQIGGAVSRAFR
ncbi:SRPBCC family protein [Ornithinimicrobium panacihumi]|uniref:SRPBCC family protein n=1 Tax=Ornithinimicrobium panacihumi TaxID=2008449 RepID=UPI003F897F73